MLFPLKNGKLCVYLKPSTDVIGEPSFCTQINSGGGVPCAVHDICDPLSLLNINSEIGSWRNSGACTPLSASDATVT